MMRVSKLAKTRFGEKVKAALESGELDRDNVYSWTTEYNDGFEDKLLREEVRALISYFGR